MELTPASRSDLLLDDDFVSEALQAYAVRPAGLGASLPVAGPSLPLKHLNVVDPLLPSNNLGRSVSRASFARIRQAFMLSYRTLDEAMNKVGLKFTQGGILKCALMTVPEG